MVGKATIVITPISESVTRPVVDEPGASGYHLVIQQNFAIAYSFSHS